MGDLTGFAKQYADSLAGVSKRGVLITDNDQVIAGAGSCRNLSKKTISKALEERFRLRTPCICNRGEERFVTVVEGDANSYQQEMIVPILTHGDVMGGIVLLEDNKKAPMGETEKKLALAAADFFGRVLEA